MKKLLKAAAVCLVAVLLLTTLSACSASMEEVAGTYYGSYEYNGNVFTRTIVLTEEGTYSEISLKNGAFNGTETGDYEIKGSKVILYDSSSITYHGQSTPYKYKNGVLINNDHKFVKQ